MLNRLRSTVGLALELILVGLVATLFGWTTLALSPTQQTAWILLGASAGLVAAGGFLAVRHARIGLAFLAAGAGPVIGMYLLILLVRRS